MPEEKNAGGTGQGPAGIGGRLGKTLGAHLLAQEQQGAADSRKEQAGGGGLAGKGFPSPPSAAGMSEEERAALSSRAESLASRLSGLRTQASLADLRTRLAQLDSTLGGLPVALEEVRRGGYLYRAYLEKKVEVLRQQWSGLRDRLDREAAQEGRLLAQQADSLQQRLSAMGARLNAAALDALERDVGSLEGRVGDVLRAIEGAYDAIEGNVRQTERQIQSIRWMQEQVAGASFGLRPDENIVEAVAARCLTQGEKDGPKGILYLTDQRLLFEQKEDVATRKFLFITTEKERLQKLLLEAPIGGVQPRASERGAIFKKELLELSLSQATVSQALLRLEADSEQWAALIGRVRSGDIAGEKVGAREGVPVQVSAAAAPTVCPTCGANITTEIVRGMQSVTCEYCGTVIRL